MNSILSKAKMGMGAGGRPPAVVEVTQEGALAAALSSADQSPVYAFAGYAPGTLVPGIGEPNLRPPEAVANAIRSALNQVSPRLRAVTLVVPDTAVRVFVLDFDSLPSKAAEAIPVLRFRLRKMVPFDVEHAGLSYQVLKQDRAECKVLAAVLPGQILAEYEGAVRSAGYEPGAVLPSSLVALDAIDSMEAVLAANLTDQSLTTSITSGNDLLLYRTIDLPEEPGLRVQEVQRGIAVAVAYFEDKLQMRPQTLHYAGRRAGNEFARWIDDAELTVVDLTPPAEGGAMTSLGPASIAGVAGALARQGARPHPSAYAGASR